jgi:hypothetical protein
MSHLSPTHHEINKCVSPHETYIRVEPSKFPRFKFKPKQVNYSSQFKQRYLPLDFSEVVYEEDELSSDNEQTAPTILLHTLTGIQPRSGRTMHVLVTVNGAKLMALLDSGSTHNFIDTESTRRAGV